MIGRLVGDSIRFINWLLPTLLHTLGSTDHGVCETAFITVASPRQSYRLCCRPGVDFPFAVVGAPIPSGHSDESELFFTLQPRRDCDSGFLLSVFA